MRVWKGFGLRTAMALGILCLVSGLCVGVAWADRFVGFDADESGTCITNTIDMGRWHGASDVGTDFTFDVYFDELGSTIQSYGCVFCIKDTTHLASWSWEYEVYASWSTVNIVSEHTPYVAIPVSASISSTYPKARCFMLQATDWSLGNLLSSPVTCGTFTYQVADEGSIQFIIDGANTSVFYWPAGVNVVFDEAGQACPENTGTEAQSWGSIKKLFR
ncbi:MAG: hypothetical protein JW958_11955 [Candidatus Eisenbacteria bacterium]|nr:hypothetical protein [Candidatus Eisenbacteria bacterium]